jgi:hypothetical protein
LTARFGVEDMLAQAKAESWVSDLSSALLSLQGGGGALLKYANSSAPSFTISVITNDGVVETGLNSTQTLLIGDPSNPTAGWDQATGTVSQYVDNGTTYNTTAQGNSNGGGITFTSGTENISGAIEQQIMVDQNILATYGGSNSTLAAYYSNAIASLEAELAADNLVDPQTGAPLDVYVMVVNIDPIYADAGHIFTQAVQLEGDGQWVTPTNVSVQITNYTPAYLNIYGITIPTDEGGLYYNGILETSNADIAGTAGNGNAGNEQNIQFINRTLSGAGNPIAELTAVTPSFAAIPSPSTRRRPSSSTMCSISIRSTSASLTRGPRSRSSRRAC